MKHRARVRIERGHTGDKVISYRYWDSHMLAEMPWMAWSLQDQLKSYASGGVQEQATYPNKGNVKPEEDLLYVHFNAPNEHRFISCYFWQPSLCCKSAWVWRTSKKNKAWLNIKLANAEALRELGLIPMKLNVYCGKGICQARAQNWPKKTVSHAHSADHLHQSDIVCPEAPWPMNQIANIDIYWHSHVVKE